MSYDDYGYELEAIEQERFDADMQMAEYARESRELARLHAKGVCTHGSGLGYKSPSFYDATEVAAMLAVGRFANREGFHGEQSEIGEGNVLCTDCGLVQEDPFA